MKEVGYKAPEMSENEFGLRRLMSISVGNGCHPSVCSSLSSGEQVGFATGKFCMCHPKDQLETEQTSKAVCKFVKWTLMFTGKLPGSKRAEKTFYLYSDATLGSELIPVGQTNQGSMQVGWAY